MGVRSKINAKVLKFYATVTAHISDVLEAFEVCNSLKYSRGNWLSDNDTPILHNSSLRARGHLWS